MKSSQHKSATTSGNLWKPHPEAPDLESARLCFCLFEMKSGETKKQNHQKGVEGSSHIDPDQDADALDAMLNGIQGIQDRATGSDETPGKEDKPGEGTSSSKEETPGKEDKPGKGDKPGNSSKRQAQIAWCSNV